MGALFRGIIAPASLKPAGDGRGGDHVGLFRGIIAPASLKLPLRVGSSTPHDQLFRGIIAPASLKPAGFLMARLRQWLRFSGASSPRPH